MRAEDPEDSTDARLEAAAQLLETMAQELRKLKQTQRKTRRKNPGIQKGDRIRMTRPKDPHVGRTGEVLRRRGTMYWDLRLDADATRSECLLYRMDSSLKVVNN
jgi:hypothetical protein